LYENYDCIDWLVFSANFSSISAILLRVKIMENIMTTEYLVRLKSKAQQYPAIIQPYQIFKTIYIDVA
jgi:hypothetical protein